jgi:hypothetical protein
MKAGTSCDVSTARVAVVAGATGAVDVDPSRARTVVADDDT